MSSLPTSRHRIAVVVGNPRPHSRTRTVAETLASALIERLGHFETDYDLIELADLGADLFDAGSPEVRKAIDTVGAAGLVIVATPVYRGSFTGLLKLFLDLLPGDVFGGDNVIPVTLSETARHREVADAALRWVLFELYATLPIASFTLTERELADLPQRARRWICEYSDMLVSSQLVSSQLVSSQPASDAVSF